MPAGAVILVAALVTGDDTALRAAPSDLAPRQSTLWRGDWLEVRGEQKGFLQVWDHRHERPGFVRQESARSFRLDESSASDLRAIALFERDQAGAESLGIGAAALYLKAAPAGQSGTDVLDALGTMAGRLARRASARQTGPADRTLAAHLEVVGSYGVKLTPLERKERTLLCYDGDAFARVLLGGAPIERARAALALTAERCLAEDLGPVALEQWNAWRLGVLDKADPGAVPAHVAARLRLRRAEALATLAWTAARQGRTEDGGKRAGEAQKTLLLVDRAALAEEDAAWNEDVGARVGAVRWIGAPVTAKAALATARKAGTGFTLASRDKGETCVRLVETAADGKVRPLPGGERCTWGLPHAASARVAPGGRTATIEVQHGPGWLELWLFRRGADGGFTQDVLSAAATEPDLGWLELGGFSPDGGQMLLARCSRDGAGGPVRRSFEVRSTATLAVVKQAFHAERLLAFQRWSAPDWRASTLALR